MLRYASHPPSDPFTYKSLPKWYPRRLTFTLRARLNEWKARRHFARYVLPSLDFGAKSHRVNVRGWEETAVTVPQMECLLAALALTENISGIVVEVGCYRGVTTACLAANTRRQVIAIDPYIGYGGVEEDLAVFRQRTRLCSNVGHWRLTSGEGGRKMRGRTVSFVFVDAVHDFANTSFDAWLWGSLLVPQGCIAFHDTDDFAFAGTRRAVWEMSRAASYQLKAHVEGLTIFTKLSAVDPGRCPL
jgi:hypothetical protein